MAATPSRVEDLTPAQRDALAAFLRRVAGGEVRSDAYLVTRADFDGWRLATRLGFLDDGHAGSPLFRVTDAGTAFLRTLGDA